MNRPLLAALAPIVILLVLAGCAWVWPQFFAPLRPAIVPGLGLIMFAMGTTLDWPAVRAVLAGPRWLVVGVLLQFTVMPLAAFAIAALLSLPPALAAGLILTGACPGGTASNVMVYLARGNVALSVAMTICSTLAAPIATPLLTLWLAGARVEVPTLAMFQSILLVVLLPVALGMVARALFAGIITRLNRWLPWVSFVLVALIVATIVALNHDNLALPAMAVVLAVVLHNATGLAGGYGLARLLGADTSQQRAIALEVGMQNSGLATALAIKFFPATAALPAAVFSLWHNLSGLALALCWGRQRR